MVTHYILFRGLAATGGLAVYLIDASLWDPDAISAQLDTLMVRYRYRCMPLGILLCVMVTLLLLAARLMYYV